MPSPLDLSTKYYFWKPFMAYFEAFELKAYRDFVRFPDGLILDLGCSDGIFAQMLKELLGIKTPLIGGDYDGRKLQRAAQRTSVYFQTLRLDASHLPFKKESFDAVLSNAVLYCLRPNPEQAVKEVERILKKGGIFTCTVPTHLAEQHYYIIEVLERIGLLKLANLCRQRINTRLGNVSAFPPCRWCGILEERGLSIRKVIPYISEQISRQWSLLFLTPFRAMSVLRIVPWKQVHRLASIIQKGLMVRSYTRLSAVETLEYGDYILIVSQKS